MESHPDLSPGEGNRISVALCTYNGEEFLPQQLTSIEKQTRLPDEVIICDDRSSDRTVDILKEFAASASFPVKIIVNQENIGSTKNFEQAIRACTGNFIALSDQDDIWYPIRLERSEQELLAHPEAGLVFSDADIIDGQDQLLETRLWPTFQFSERTKQQLSAGEYDLCIKRWFATGATMMFRASLRARCLPIGAGWLHDAWIASTVAVFGDLRPIDKPLIRYRRHALQQVGPNRSLSAREIASQRWEMISGAKKAGKYWDQLAREAKHVEVLLSALSNLPLETQERARLLSYHNYLEFLRFRAGLPRRRVARLFPVLSNYSGYSRHFRGWKSAARDLFLSR